MFCLIESKKMAVICSLFAGFFALTLGAAQSDAWAEVKGVEKHGADDRVILRCWQNGKQIIEEKALGGFRLPSKLSAQVLQFSKGRSGKKGKLMLYVAAETTCLVESEP